RVLETVGDRMTIEMACRRSGIPLKWRSYLWIRRPERRMRFQHIAGPARGMEVEWRLDEAEGGVRVTIHHDLALQVPVVRTALGRCGVGEENHAAYVRGGWRAVHPMLALSVFVGAGSCNVAIEFGLTGPATANGDSCSAGAIALSNALRYIQLGQADRMLAGG